MPHSEEQEKLVITKLREGLRIMRNAMQGGQGKIFMEIDEPDVARDIIATLQKIKSVTLIEATFPDQQIACACFGVKSLIGEEHYALKNAPCPLKFVDGTPGAAVIDFTYTKASVTDLNITLQLHEWGIENTI